MNKTATYKEVFKTLETNECLAYSKLPENTLAQKIYKLRMVKGYTQREFAKACNIGYSSLCKYELGSPPSGKNLSKIFKTFNIDIDIIKKQNA